MNAWPVMFRAPGPARNTAMAAMSSGSLGRPMGILASRASSSSLMVWPVISARPDMVSAAMVVSVEPGQMAFTLMSYLPSCRAAMLVMEMTAPLLAA